MKRFGLLLASLAGMAATALLAEPGDDNVGQAVYTHERPPVAVPVKQVARPTNNTLNPTQQRIMVRRGQVRPGIYRFRSLHAGRCAASYVETANPPLVLFDCNHPAVDEGVGQFAVLSHPSGGYTIRSLPQRNRFSGMRPSTAGELGNCLTVARGVLIGAPRIELRACDNTGSDWARTGADDQRFFLNKVGDDTWQVALAETGDSSDCWVLRGGSGEVLNEVIRWQCNRTPDQLWQLQLVGPIPEGHETRLLDMEHWYRTPSGHFSILGADGLDLTGPVYNSFDTANDGGDYCKKRCAELDQCKAWTWTGPGYVVNSNDPPKCYWKSAAGEPINRGPSSFGKLRSGIVRP